MLKKLLLMSTISSLYSANPMGDIALSKAPTLADYSIRFAIAVYMVDTLAPNILNSLEPSDEKNKQMVIFGKRLVKLAAAALGVYGAALLFSAGKEIYDYNYPSQG